MLKWLNYHHLLYFRAIALEGSIAEASRKLNVGQSSISAQLKQLEDSLGKKLFERKNRSLHLTEAGKVALEYANEIFEKGEEFIQVFNEENLGIKGHYRIGASDSIPKSLTCLLMESAESAGKDCFFSLTEGNPEELIAKVLFHEIDIALLNSGAKTNEDGIMSKSVGKSPVSIYGAKEFRSLSKGFPHSLKGKPFILPTSHSKLRSDIEHAFFDANVQYDLLAEAQDSGVKKLMAIHGRGLVFLPDVAGDELVKEKKLVKIGSFPSLYEEYWLIARKRVLKNPITDALMEKFKLQNG